MCVCVYVNVSECVCVCVCERYCVVWFDVTLFCHIILINTNSFNNMPHNHTANHQVLFPSLQS